MCTWLFAVCGGSSSHSASISRLTATVRFEASSSVASTVRWRAAPMPTGVPSRTTSNGPSSLNSIPPSIPDSAHVSGAAYRPSSTRGWVARPPATAASAEVGVAGAGRFCDQRDYHLRGSTVRRSPAPDVERAGRKYETRGPAVHPWNHLLCDDAGAGRSGLGAEDRTRLGLVNPDCLLTGWRSGRVQQACEP